MHACMHACSLYMSGGDNCHIRHLHNDESAKVDVDMYIRYHNVYGVSITNSFIYGYLIIGNE